MKNTDDQMKFENFSSRMRMSFCFNNELKTFFNKSFKNQIASI